MRFLKSSVAAIAAFLLAIGVAAPANAAGAYNVQLTCGGNQVKHRMYSGGSIAYTQRQAPWNCGGKVTVQARYHRGNPNVTYQTPLKTDSGHARVSPGNVVSAVHTVKSPSDGTLAIRTT